MIGRTVSHYEILEKLGRGGMGVVYKAKDQRLDRFVAIKFIAAELSPDSGATRRFLQEARTASSFDHPNICTIHEIGNTPDDQLFIVMAYHEGETLKARIARGPMGFNEVRDLTAQIARGLAKAHSGGVVHRDIKPANVIITVDGIAKILDFGVARIGSDITSTNPDVVRGTVAYMAPEQIRGEADPRSDLWSLGIVLYEMLTSRLPYERDRTEALLYAVLNETWSPVQQLRAGVPQDLQRVLERCLNKNPIGRYQRAEDLLADLASPDHASDSGIPATSTKYFARLPSIAVLPFSNLSGDPEGDYFSDGLTEELIYALAQVEGVRVVSRTSAFEFKGKALDVRTIGERLRVGTILEGGVRRSGNRLRITVQLTSAADGYQLWSQRFEREMEDIFAIQDDIARTVAETLKLKLSQPNPVERRHGGNLSAYHLYLKGQYEMHKQTPEGLREALALFEQLIASDPDYAPAYAGVVEIYMFMAFWGVMPPLFTYPKMREAALKADALDPSCPEAQIALARCAHYLDWNRPEAERRYQRAIEISPAHADAHFSFSVFLLQDGRLAESLAFCKRARELDPLNATTGTGVAWLYYYTGDYDRARQECQHVLTGHPGYFEAYGCMAMISEKKGELAEAVEWQQKAFTAMGGAPIAQVFLARMYAIAGRRDEARKLYEEICSISAERYVAPSAIATVDVALGEHDRALDRLYQALETRDLLLVYAKVFPPFDGLRQHPRFQALLQTIGVEVRPDEPTRAI